MQIQACKEQTMYLFKNITGPSQFKPICLKVNCTLTSILNCVTTFIRSGWQAKKESSVIRKLDVSKCGSDGRPFAALARIRKYNLEMHLRVKLKRKVDLVDSKQCPTFQAMGGTLSGFLYLVLQSPGMEVCPFKKALLVTKAHFLFPFLILQLSYSTTDRCMLFVLQILQSLEFL